MIYVFKCPNCSAVIEIEAKISECDKLHPLCFNCGEGEYEMEKQIVPFSFQLIGSGWAKDGYSSPQRKETK